MLAAWQAAAQTNIGTAAIARNDVSGLLGDSRRDLSVGDQVFQDEEISTGETAEAQILFLDETSLTLGPNSRVALTSMVYDPNQGTGELVLNAVSGSFRFISGSSPSENYKIETPLGTIGVRGTITTINLNPTIGFISVTTNAGGTIFCVEPERCVSLPAGTFAVSDGQQLSGAEQSGSQGCGSSGSYASAGGRSYCSTSDEIPIRLYIEALQPGPAQQPIIVNPPGQQPPG